MATFNLVRNSRVFFSTNVNAATGVLEATGYLAANTQEVQVLDGFSFSQATNADTVQISEAGATPVRGQRTFNTSLNNVEISFSTYLRPYKPSTVVTAEESLLWNALLGSSAFVAASSVTIGGTPTGATYVTTTGILTIAGTTMTYAGVTVGDIVTITGLGGVSASQANVPAKVLTLGASAITLQLLTAPTTALTLTAGVGVKFNYAAWTENVAVSGDTVVGNTAYSQVTTAVSNKNQLQKFGFIIKVDGITYAIDNCAMDQASIDFNLDGIATVAWTAKGTAIRERTVAWSAASDPVLTGDLAGTLKGKITAANYITNKLSTITLAAEIGGGGTAYTLALTGGNITIANNITYVVPANLGTVNLPIGYFTGSRAVSGNVTAYLRTGSANTAGLLSAMLAAAASSAETKYQVNIAIGGSSNAIRVETLIVGAMLQIPTIDAQAVMSTTINFTAQGTDYLGGTAAEYDLENVNDLRIRYFSA